MRARVLLAAAGLFAAEMARAQAVAAPADRALAREILAELVGQDTSEPNGDVTAAAEKLAARLRAGGFPEKDVVVVGPPKRGNLVARLRGNGKKKPVLLLAHLDVVAARREDWSFDPFTLLEKDGFFYGRGTSDIKDGAAILVTVLLKMKREGVVPDRDVVVALTADEENGPDDGVDWLLSKRRDLIDAELCLNTDGGDFQEKDGKRLVCSVQASEKQPVSFVLEVRDKGGHSSLPVKENAIYRLARALSRLAAYEFPVHLNEVTRAYLAHRAKTEVEPLASDLKKALATPDSAAANAGAAQRQAAAAIERLSSSSPYYNALFRTTCVATMLEGGHAPNALPQLARATVNCRILPGETPDEVLATLRRVVDDDRVVARSAADGGVVEPSPASPLRDDVLAAVAEARSALWPEAAVVPVMETGATDGIFLRRAGIPTYGISGVFIDMDDVRAHGRDERVSVASFYEGLEFWSRLVRAAAGGGTRRK